RVWSAWACSLPAELETALEILLAEANDGFRDRMVLGGLSGFFRNLAGRSSREDVREAATLLGQYASLDYTERVARIDRVAKLLAHSGRAAPTVSRPPRATRAEPPHVWLASPPTGTTLETPIESLKGIGPVRARLYRKLGLQRIKDLLFHFPTRHQSFPPAT